MYIVDTKRTPVGKFLGSLSKLSASELTIPLFKYFLKTYPFLRTHTDEVILGNVLSAGVGMNPARIASVRGGMHHSVPAYTLNQVCASGMNAVIQAWRAIRAGDADLVLAGGMESMSQAPFLLRGAREGFRFGSHNLIDSLQLDGLYCSLCQEMMGNIAERIAQKYKISRKLQDRYALESHQRAVAAQKSKVFSREMVELPQLKLDEGPRKDTSMVKLAALKPVFNPEGSVTIGNTSSVNDGAALALIASETALKKYHLKPMAQIVDAVFVGIEPKLMGMAPKLAVEKLLKRNKLVMKDIDLFEINEAFAVQVLAVMKELKLTSSKVNIYGGGLSIGHPLGMSGVRIIGTLVNGLKRTHGKLGIATLCVGGGQGAAILLRNM